MISSEGRWSVVGRKLGGPRRHGMCWSFAAARAGTSRSLGVMSAIRPFVGHSFVV